MLSMPFALITTITIVFLAVAFALQNDQVVAIQFFGWTFEGSLVLILLTTLCLGIIIHILAAMPAQIRKAQQMTQLNKRVAELEQPQTPHEPPAGEERKPVT